MNIYIHIPFCRQKCPYCKFALTPIFNDTKKRRYLEYVKKEIRDDFSGKQQVDTIYFGGGTPSILTLEEVSSILDLFETNTRTEITFECNPEDISEAYIRGLSELGINRFSLGVQSLNDTTLKTIHRSNRESIIQALSQIEYALIGRKSSVNIDFILGLPDSLPGETLNNIKELHEYFPTIRHTSVYMLEDGLYPKEWKKKSIDESAMEDEYNKIVGYFIDKNWNHYEISNWAKPGYESVHNQGYWDHTDTRGYGLSATSYIHGERWMNSDAFSLYYRGEIKEREYLNEQEKKLEKIIYDLRTFRLEGNYFDKEILRELEEKKYITQNNGKIMLTSSGIFRENTILASLADVAQW